MLSIKIATGTASDILACPKSTNLKIESTLLSGLSISILSKIASSPSLFLEYLAPTAASNSGVNEGLLRVLEVSDGQIETFLIFITIIMILGD